jgi:hypothetical protein
MDKSLETTLRTQNNIGWEHFMRGHMTIKWGHLISQHISTQPQHKIAAKKWGAKPIAINWKYILQLWQQRSEELHGISTEQTEQSHQWSMIEEIQYIESGLQNIPFDIANLINLSIEEVRKLPIQALKAYLYGAKLVARSMRSKTSQSQPSLHQILAQMPPMFHKDPTDKRELDPGKTTWPLTIGCPGGQNWLFFTFTRSELGKQDQK